MWGASASDGSLRAAADVGLDLSRHRSQPLTAKLVERADIILAMTLGHMAQVEDMGGTEKVLLVSEFIDGADPGEPIADPFGGTAEEYADVRDHISEAVEALLNRLSAILAP
jgi:protein-tyrosine phosphatase